MADVEQRRESDCHDPVLLPLGLVHLADECPVEDPARSDVLDRAFDEVVDFGVQFSDTRLDLLAGQLGHGDTNGLLRCFGGGGLLGNDSSSGLGGLLDLGGHGDLLA